MTATGPGTLSLRRGATHAALLALVTALFAVAGPGTTPHAAAAPPPGHPDSVGDEFWLVFMENSLGAVDKTLFITGPTATTGTVEIPGLGFSTTFTVTPGAVSSVPLPVEARLEGSGHVEQLGIHVTAGEEVAVYGLSHRPASTDAFVGLPVDVLGTEYLVLGYEGGAGVLGGESLAVVATTAATSVTITRPGQAPTSFTLGTGEAVQVHDLTASLTGTEITSDHPVAVFGGNRCAEVPLGTYACDHLVEQIPPTATWGTSFVTQPLASRLRGDTFRVLASEDGTAVSIDGAVVATLGRGAFYETILAGPSEIEASAPVLVAQYANGYGHDFVDADPFMMLVPPVDRFHSSYTVMMPRTGFRAHFVNVVAPTGAAGSLTLDGAVVPASEFSPIGAGDFSGAQLPVGPGAHVLEADVPFGTFVYGFNRVDSYGYPAGYSLAPWPDGSPPACHENGLDAIPLGGLLSGVLHRLDRALEEALAGLGDAVHGLNCDLVVPVEDAVDGLWSELS